MAAEVMRYLWCLNEPRSQKEIDDNEEAAMAKNHAEKWADNMMNTDKEFCEFIIVTLRMDTVFNHYFNGMDWHLKDPRGKKVHQIIMKYGDKIATPPDPKEYKKIIKMWMRWSPERMNKI